MDRKFGFKMVTFVVMPIQCLTAIRFAFQYEEAGLPIDPRIEPFVAGIYEFDLHTLPQEVPLFNDGLPALMILPQSGLTSLCRVQQEEISLGSIWFAAGTMLKSSWLRPDFAVHEKLTIVRFFPSAWAALFGKQAVSYPYVHNLADYHPTLASVLNQVYEAPSIMDGLVDLLAGLYAKKSYDRTALVFDRTAMRAESSRREVTEQADPDDLCKYHPKWIQRQFKRSLGISPYQFAQLQRFILAYHQLHACSSVNLHGVADSCGYYDANHLIKDFRKYLGISPRQYFKEMQA